jgi:Ca-activated chloride channel homolog
LEIMVHVRNYTAKPARAPLTVALGEKILVRDEIEVGADDRRVLIYGHEGGLTGTLSARIEIDDDFATDNQAYLTIDDLPVVRVHYVGPGNPYLNNLLRILPNVELTSALRWEPGAAKAQATYDIVIFDRVEVPALTEGNVILIDTVAPNLPLALTGKVQAPRVLSPLAKHPLTEGLSLGDLRVGEALRVSLKGEGIVLARSAEGPLLVALELRRLRLLFLGFDLTASDLPLRVAFPVLIHNALQWFQPQRREFPAQWTAAGTPFVCPR